MAPQSGTSGTLLQGIVGALASAVVAKVSLTLGLALLAGVVLVLFVQRLGRGSLADAVGRLLFLPKVSLVLAVPMAALAASATYYVATRDHDPTTAAGRASLRQLVDADLRRNCTRASVGDSEQRVLGRLRCTDVDDDVVVTYSLMATKDDVNSAIDSRIRGFGLPSGSCFSQEIAVSTYSRGDQPDAGRLLCFTGDDGPRIEWSVDDLRVHASAHKRGSAGRSLIAWWSKDGGISETNARREFPDEYERELVSHVPAAFATTCDRNDFSTYGSRATVYCRPPGGAVDGVWYLALPTKEALDKLVEARAKPWRKIDGSCRRTGGAPAVRPYRDGVRVCYESGDVAWVEWSDDQLLIFAYAKLKGSLFDLYDWWLKSAGPVS